MIHSLFLVAVGGALGASSRFLFNQTLLSLLSNQAAIVNTLLVNIIGSFFIGIVALWLMSSVDGKLFIFGLNSTQLKWLLIVGFLGSFTTVSSFSLETMLLFNEGFYIKALTNIILTATLSVCSCGLGMWLFHKWS